MVRARLHFPMGGTSDDSKQNLQLPLGPCTNISRTAGNAAITIKWSDPVDVYHLDSIYSTTYCTAKWQRTVLVRKAGSYPTSASDGTTVATSTTRNQYASTGFTDSGLANGTVYYYKLFSYTDGGVVNSLSQNQFTEKPLAYGKVSASGEITDTWEEIHAAIQAGVYKTVYKVGNYKLVSYGSQGTIKQAIGAFDTDDMVSGGKAPITWLPGELLKDYYKMKGTSGTGNYDNIGGYAASEMKTYLEGTIWNLLDSECRKYIVPVKKTCRMGSNESGRTDTLNLSIWLPSVYEVYGTAEATYAESSGYYYSEYFKDDASRIRYTQGTSSAYSWWLRSANYSNTTGFCRVTSGGTRGNNYAYGTRGVAPGFCTA